MQIKTGPALQRDAGGVVTDIASDPSVILRTAVFIRERLEHHYRPDSIRQAVENEETRLSAEAAELDTLRKRIMMRMPDEEFEYRDYMDVLEKIEKDRPADINTLGNQLHLLRKLYRFESSGILRSERDGFYWYITEDGSELLSALRKLVDREEALDDIYAEKRDGVARMRELLEDYESAIGNIKRIAPRMVALEIEGFRRPIYAELAILALRRLMDGNTLHESEISENFEMAAPAGAEVGAHDMRDALELLSENGYIQHNRASRSWHLPAWDRKRAQRLIEKLGSEEGKSLVRQYAEYKGVMRNAEEEFEDWGRYNPNGLIWHADFVPAR